MSKKYEVPAIVGLSRYEAISCITALNGHAIVCYKSGNVSIGDDASKLADIIAKRAGYTAQHLKTMRVLERKKALTEGEPNVREEESS